MDLRTQTVRPLCVPLVLLLVSVAAPGCGRTHEAEGFVLKVNSAAREVTVSHDPIPGVMDAMVMSFVVAGAEDLTDVRPGDRIAFRLRVRGGASSIDRVRLLSAGSSQGAGRDISSTPALPIGARVPSFTLTNHRGDAVTLAQQQGKVVVVSFIYTRCPLPDYCPRVMTNLAALRDRFRDRLDRDLVLLTITFDPKHDTPPTLQEYARRYGADVAGWHLLTGDIDTIGRICTMLGVEFYPEEGMITHTLQTVVISRSGHLAAAAEGRGFSAKQLSDLVELQMGQE